MHTRCVQDDPRKGRGAGGPRLALLPRRHRRCRVPVAIERPRPSLGPQRDRQCSGARAEPGGDARRTRHTTARVACLRRRPRGARDPSSGTPRRRRRRRTAGDRRTRCSRGCGGRRRDSRCRRTAGRRVHHTRNRRGTRCENRSVLPPTKSSTRPLASSNRSRSKTGSSPPANSPISSKLARQRCRTASP